MCISPFDWAIVVVTTQRVDWINDKYLQITLYVGKSSRERHPAPPCLHPILDSERIRANKAEVDYDRALPWVTIPHAKAHSFHFHLLHVNGTVWLQICSSQLTILSFYFRNITMLYCMLSDVLMVVKCEIHCVICVYHAKQLPIAYSLNVLLVLVQIFFPSLKG